MSRPTLSRAALVVVLVCNLAIWSVSRHKPGSFSPLGGPEASRLLTSPPKACLPLSLPHADQCSHVKSVCEESDTFLSIQYLHAYFCAQSSARPAIFFALVFWLAFLFFTLGISASDFFSPNLASIAQFLGLDENVAGVTFLALGNGSPDVFSTFSAMRAGSGSLAIGELLGAASFIVSVVVGSMCFIKPFQVQPIPFLRDVGFFTIAVAMLLAITHDSVIHLWEAMSLVTLYFIYVAVVVIGAWWEKRKLAMLSRKLMIRQEYSSEVLEPYTDLDITDNNIDSDISRVEESVVPNGSHLEVTSTELTSNGRMSMSTPGLRITTPSVHIRHHEAEFPFYNTTQLPSFSILGALEFRQVIQSLQQESSAGALSAFHTPISSYAGGHYHSRRYSNRTSRSTSPALATGRAEEIDPWDAALCLPLNDRSGNEVLRTSHSNSSAKLPTLDATTPGLSNVNGEVPTSQDSSVRNLAFIPSIHRILFPTLHGFRRKSFTGKSMALLAVLPVLALTLTLPVIVAEDTSKTEFDIKPSEQDAPLMDFEEEGLERTLTAVTTTEPEPYEFGFNKWLTAVQAIFGPIFCAGVIFARSSHLVLAVGLAAAAGSLTALLIGLFADRGNDHAGRLLRCFMGFIVAIVWIMAIADEVVSVLKTFGVIFGLSDAIIGLTVFAIGNSMADFVADISVASFAPIMAFSACFGGPMLNILLGVGGSGAYVVHHTGNSFEFHFSATLLVSTVGLLVLLITTLIFVPYNGFWLTKRWGVFLICSYLVMMLVNVVVEIRRAR